MDTKKLLDNINRFSQYGDSVRIARMVNKKREARGEKTISRGYVNMMLNNKRTMVADVAEVAEKYFEAQAKISQLAN
jgi:hypothetical protein